MNISLSNERIPACASPVELAFKRCADIFISAAGTVCLSPLMVAIAAVIKLDSPGPALHRQKRIGKGGELFEIFKFRTMFVGTPEVATDRLADLSSAVTRAGKFLRQSSLDELPQLFNVLAGDMSIVGPRPALYNQTELTAKRSAAGVLRFAPGVTGWAQVNGRDNLPDDKKVEYDTWYCNHWSCWLDLKIVIRTIITVISRRGAI